jgi:hypothetical protein
MSHSWDGKQAERLPDPEVLPKAQCRQWTLKYLGNLTATLSCSHPLGDGYSFFQCGCLSFVPHRTHPDFAFASQVCDTTVRDFW